MVRFDLDLSPAQEHAVREARADGLRVMGVVTGGSRDPQVYARTASSASCATSPRWAFTITRSGTSPTWSRRWPTADDPDRATTEYMAMVKAAYPRIKAADPRSVVLVGALSRRESVGGRPNDWVEAMYEKGLAGNFDAISLHPYTDPEIFPARTPSPPTPGSR